ncbi:nuclear factor 7, brain-like [Spea bombifrons]|uniref:nuclear factor 7, brain-like n=1 Tax=Spea bombifrons TaxID=233779 RepID=UPI00234AF237|nr:nuclear factor 7, brain-like [Spea bombifrons]
MASTATTELEKAEAVCAEEVESNPEEPGEEEEDAENGEEGAGEEDEEEEEEEVKVGNTYPCRRADGNLHDAEIVKTRMNKQAGKEEFYVHYAGLNRRQNEWVDKTRLVLAKAAKEDPKEEANGTDREMTDVTEQPEAKPAQKRKIEEPEPEVKKVKVEEPALNSSLVGPGGDFAEELTCPLCVELFKDPVMVECGHNFCRSCIDKAWNGHDSFSCPECKEVISEHKYTTNRALANLVKKTAVTSVTPVEKKARVPENCPEHDERLKLYCKDDGMLGCVICRDSLKHASHNFLPILDAVGVYREELSAIVAPLEASLKVTEQLAGQQNEKITQHKSNVSEYKQHIESEFEKLHTFLKEKEAKLLEQLQEQGDSLLEEMESNMIKMQENRDCIKKTISVANERLGDKDSISFLTDIKSFIDKCVEHQRDMVSSGNTILSKDLSQGTFKGPIQYMVWKEMKSFIVPYLAPMMLDPSTAHPNLLLSDGLTSVKYGDAKLPLPDNPKRFSQCILVLGAQGFDSGRHYWEVEVGDKTAWDVGMASESSNRKGKIKLNPKNGYWAIWLRNGNAYKALESPSKALTLNAKPRKIGVYVDYEGGQVSFYNADDMSAIYTFNATFTEKLYPYLSPFLHDSGKNTEPLRLLHN